MPIATDPVTPAVALLPARWRVEAVTPETADVVSLTLGRDTDSASCDWAPGQFNMLGVFGIGEVPISVSGGTRDKPVHTIRAVGPVTRALAALEPGSTIGLRGPFGTPWPIAGAMGGDVIIVAGGIGLAPLRGVLDAIATQRNHFGNVRLVYGARTPVDLLFVADWQRWRAAGIELDVTVDHAGSDWSGNVGVVTTLIRKSSQPGARSQAFLCGPEIMMRFAAAELMRGSVTADALWVSLERNMQCAVGWCGHCQLGPEFVCIDGPVFSWQRTAHLLGIRGL